MFGLLLFCVLFCFASCLVTESKTEVVSAAPAVTAEPIVQSVESLVEDSEGELPPVEVLLDRADELINSMTERLEEIGDSFIPDDRPACMDDLKDKKWTVTRLRKVALALPPGRKIPAPHKLSKAALTQRLLFSKVTLKELESLTA